MNPNRICGVCAKEDTTGNLRELLDIIEIWKSKYPVLGDIRYDPDEKAEEELATALRAASESNMEWATGCPACLLAAQRQGEVNLRDFDYSHEMDAIRSWWSDKAKADIDIAY